MQFQHGEGELVLKETHPLTVDVAVFFHQLALQGVGFLLVAGNGALLNQQVHAGEWELHRGAQADVGMIAAGFCNGMGVEEQRVVLFPSRQRRMLLVVVGHIVDACRYGRCRQQGYKNHYEPVFHAFFPASFSSR